MKRAYARLRATSLSLCLVLPSATSWALDRGVENAHVVKKTVDGSAFSTSIELGYDGDAYRSAPWDVNLGATWLLNKAWQLSAGFEGYAKGFGFHGHDDQSQAYGEWEWSMTALDDTDWDFSLSFKVAGPGLTARQGADLIPAATLGYTVTDKLDLNVSVGDWLSTAKAAGQRHNTPFVQLDASFDTGWPISEDDGFWTAIGIQESDQVEDRTPLSTLEAGYKITWRAATFTVGLGHDLSSPYERHNLYLKASIQWRL